MNFQDIMNRMLPPHEGATPFDRSIKAGISSMGTNVFCDTRRRDIPRRQIHSGVDINYAGQGQGIMGLNWTHPTIYSPVEGVIIDVQPSSNGVIIMDANGLVHELRHFDSLNEAIRIGDLIGAGAPIGTMGNEGLPNRPNDLPADQHVHYTMNQRGQPRI